MLFDDLTNLHLKHTDNIKVTGTVRLSVPRWSLSQASSWILTKSAAHAHVIRLLGHLCSCQEDPTPAVISVWPNLELYWTRRSATKTWFEWGQALWWYCWYSYGAILMAFCVYVIPLYSIFQRTTLGKAKKCFLHCFFLDGN